MLLRWKRTVYPMLLAVFRPRAIWECGDMSPLLDETTSRRVHLGGPAQSHQQLRDARWKHNRVFHHERLIHWTDLDAQPAALLEVIHWASPELHQMAVVLDRYTALRRQGLNPWLETLRHHWPDPAPASPAPAS